MRRRELCSLVVIGYVDTALAEVAQECVAANLAKRLVKHVDRVIWSPTDDYTDVVQQAAREMRYLGIIGAAALLSRRKLGRGKYV